MRWGREGGEETGLRGRLSDALLVLLQVRRLKPGPQPGERLSSSMGGAVGRGYFMSKKFPPENSTREPFTGLPSWTSIHILPSPHRPGSALPEAPDP